MAPGTLSQPKSPSKPGTPDDASDATHLKIERSDRRGRDLRWHQFGGIVGCWWRRDAISRDMVVDPAAQRCRVLVGEADVLCDVIREGQHLAVGARYPPEQHRALVAKRLQADGFECTLQSTGRDRTGWQDELFPPHVQHAAINQPQGDVPAPVAPGDTADLTSRE